jgi:hypothetical protein
MEISHERWLELRDFLMATDNLTRIPNPFATLDTFATSKAPTGSHRTAAIGLATDR